MLSEAIHDMIQIVREDAQTSLLRFVPYQHMLWAVQAEKGVLIRGLVARS